MTLFYFLMWKHLPKLLTCISRIYSKLLLVFTINIGSWIIVALIFVFIVRTLQTSVNIIFIGTCMFVLVVICALIATFLDYTTSPPAKTNVCILKNKNYKGIFIIYNIYQ